MRKAVVLSGVIPDTHAQRSSQHYDKLQLVFSSIAEIVLTEQHDAWHAVSAAGACISSIAITRRH